MKKWYTVALLLLLGLMALFLMGSTCTNSGWAIETLVADQEDVERALEDVNASRSHYNLSQDWTFGILTSRESAFKGKSTPMTRQVKIALYPGQEVKTFTVVHSTHREWFGKNIKPGDIIAFVDPKTNKTGERLNPTQVLTIRKGEEMGFSILCSKSGHTGKWNQSCVNQ